MIAFLAASVSLLHPFPLMEMNAGADVPPARAVAASSCETEQLEQLCPRLLELAHSVDARLRTVTDRPSAEKIAAPLDQDMAEMLRILRQIEKIPPHTATQAQLLTSHMSDLTHLAQGYNTVVQRIIEVNAYGSDTLLQILSKYKVMDAGNPPRTDTPPPDPRLSRLEEMGDCAEDILYLLRRIKSKEEAWQAMQRLPRRSVCLSSIRDQLRELPPGVSSDQREALEAGTRRLRQLHRQIEAEHQRLKSAVFYDVPALEVICRDSLSNLKGVF